MLKNKMEIFTLVGLSILVSCALNIDTISDAKFHNLFTGEISKLSEDQVSMLNEMLENGTTRVIGKKWQAGNMVEVTTESDKTLFIYSYFGGYIKLSSNEKYYKIEDPYKGVFDKIFKNTDAEGGFKGKD